MTGLDGPSSKATFSPSFPQPRDLEEDDEDEEDDGEESHEEEEALTERSLSGQEDEEEPRTESSTAQAQKSGSPKNKWLRRPEHEANLRKRLASKASMQTASASSFVTASSNLRPKQANTKRNDRPLSFVTTPEPPQPSSSDSKLNKQDTESVPSPSGSGPSNSNSNDSPTGGDATNSRTSLLHRSTQPSPKPTLPADGDTGTHEGEINRTETGAANHVSFGMVRFNTPQNISQRNGSNDNQSFEVSRRRRSWRHLRHGQLHPGEIVKTEKMLVRIDSTVQELPKDYCENDSIRTDSRTLEKWREYVVVCRESYKEDASDFSIQLYKSRVIPAKEEAQAAKRCTHEIPLIRRSTRVNLYSSLDKTLVIWMPWKNGTKIFILRPRSASSSVEWYTFIRGTLGWKRPLNLQVNVPDLKVNLQLENPFGQVEASRNAAQVGSGNEAAMLKTIEAERAVATVIIQQCTEMLKNIPEWADVLDNWFTQEKIGLAWKRYDRLEWVHGPNEQRMYGVLAMQKSHELELRPKKHYPTSTKPIGEAGMGEPAPIEGFLIRLTSQKGRAQRLGKMFFKRLYFCTHNQYLCYCRPAKALPPPPPKASLSQTSKIPTATEITEKTPLIYAINPYPVHDGKVDWLQNGTRASRERADEEAYVEAERKINTLLSAEGFIDLCRVVKVRKVHRGSTPADDNIDQGSDVDFHEAVSDSRRDDGKTSEFDDKRTFELVLDNGLIIRLQAFDKETKEEWMTRLQRLAKYWKLRTADDMKTLKAIRQANLERLDIDEEMEAHLGQFGEKWEVTRAVASPQLFNICGISCCRAITVCVTYSLSAYSSVSFKILTPIVPQMSGTLYRKPRKHTTFLKCHIILSHSHLLIFHSTLRARTGAPIPHIQQDRQTSISLQDCYIYSGLVTEGDLLYQNRTFDANHPGHSSLPRVYLEDGWTSTDEDTMTCFVVWQARRKSFFKSGEDGGGGLGGLRRGSALGVPGRGIVFKARSRAERDHWVMGIGMEIERVQRGEEVRVVDHK